MFEVGVAGQKMTYFCWSESICLTSQMAQIILDLVEMYAE